MASASEVFRRVVHRVEALLLSGLSGAEVSCQRVWLTIVGDRWRHRCDLRVPGFQRMNLRAKPGPKTCLVFGMRAR